MKEYLLKGIDGVWKYNNSKMVFCPAYLEAVEIPEGAEVAVHYENKDSWNCGAVYFWKDNGETCYAYSCFHDNSSWVSCEKNMFKTLQKFEEDWKGKCAVVWKREKQQEALSSVTTKTPFTYDCLLGCYVEPYVGCSNGGYIISVSHNTFGNLVFEVEGKEIYYGILAKEVIFYTEDSQPLTFEQYKEMYYGATCNEDTSNEVVK